MLMMAQAMVMIAAHESRGRTDVACFAWRASRGGVLLPPPLRPACAPVYGRSTATQAASVEASSVSLLYIKLVVVQNYKRFCLRQKPAEAV
jgi:hypothetical protein